MSLVPKSPFPNVPKLPGVPQVRRSLQIPSSVPPVISAAVSLAKLFGFGAGRGWGVFDGNGRQILNPDSIVDFHTGQDYSLPTFPVQAGQFASYNRVVLPPEYTVRMSKGGNDSEREAFLAEVELIASSTSLFVIVTPERVYRGVNVKRYEVTRRGAQGAYFLSDVDVVFQQIREVVPSYIDNSQATQDALDPSARPPQSQGEVQPRTPPEGAQFNPPSSLV